MVEASINVKRACLAALLATATVPGSALAQDTSGVLTRDQIERPDLAPPDSRAAPRRVVVEGGIERPPCPLDEPRYAGVRIAVNDVVFAGMERLPGVDLSPAYAPFRGGTHPISVICSIRDQATAILREQGYLAAVQVPPQRVEDGTVRFDVLLGRMVAAYVRGDVGRSEGAIVGYVERIRDQEVFNAREAERYLLAMRDLPGYDVRLVLKPAGTGPGELIGELFVERRTFDIDFNVQNLGSRAIGRWGGLVRANFYGLTGLADRTTISAFSTADFEEQQVYQLAHDFRVGTGGTAIGARVAYALTRPDVGAANDNSNSRIEGKTLLATVEASHPLSISRAGELRLAGGLELVNQDVDFGPALLSRDRLRVAFLRLDHSAIDGGSLARGGLFSAAEPKWRSEASLEVRKGLSIFGASEGCGIGGARCAPGSVTPIEFEGDPQAFVVRATGYFELRPAPKVALSVAPRVQYASKPLFAFEEFSAGNYTIGRGYDPATLTGDSGLGAAAEIKVGSLIPQNERAFALQPFAFVDAAKVWNEGTTLFGGGDDSLVSAGGGVRGAWGRNLRFDLTAAKPLSRLDPTRPRGDLRVLLSITARLWPW